MTAQFAFHEDAIGYGLHPAGATDITTLCLSCFSLALAAPEQFDLPPGALSNPDSFGEILPWTVDDEDPVYCDRCQAEIHPGHRAERGEGYEPEECGQSDYRHESGPAADGFGNVYSDAGPGL